MFKSHLIYVQWRPDEIQGWVIDTNRRASVVVKVPYQEVPSEAALKLSFRQLLQALDEKAWYRRSPWALLHKLPPQADLADGELLKTTRRALTHAGCERVFLLSGPFDLLTEAQLHEFRTAYADANPGFV